MSLVVAIFSADLFHGILFPAVLVRLVPFDCQLVLQPTPRLDRHIPARTLQLCAFA